MAHLYTSFLRSGSNYQGRVYIRPNATTAPVELVQPGSTMVDTPSTIGSTGRRAQIMRYRRRTYIVGQFARMLVYDEYGNLRPGGLRAPRSKPVLANAAYSAGKSLGNMIGYTTFALKVGDKTIIESNPSPASPTLASAGTGREWDGIDWEPDDHHATHVCGYVSVDGSVPALAWERPLMPVGSKVAEAVSTIALGRTLPVRVGLNGQVLTDPNARGVPPYTKWCEEYHDAIFYAGDPMHPERIYVSRRFEPEAVNSTPITTNGRTEIPWLETTDGMPVTGLKRQGDELIIGTLRGIDSIQGYSYGDYAIRRISNYWGVISHWSMRRVGPLGSLFFAAPQGVTIYNSGTFRNIMEPLQTWWRDEYRAHHELFVDCFGVEDRFWESYKLLVPQFDDTTLWLVCDYNSAEAGKPIWVMDRRARKDWVAEELPVDNSASYYELYTGSCDGNVRQENVEGDTDDDGDEYQKRMVVQTPHRFMGDQGGDDAHGYTFHKLELFLKHVDEAATVKMYAGDDDAISARNPQWSKSIPATGQVEGEVQKVARTSEHHALSDVSGKGVTLRVEVVAPLAVEYRGWGVEFVEGPQTQPLR